MSKYKVGDVVTIRSWEALVREFGPVDQDNELKINGVIFSKTSSAYGSKLTITSVNGKHGYITTENYYIINDIIAHNFTYGEEIEVRTTGGGWHKRIFVSYIDGSKNSYTCISNEDNFEHTPFFLTSNWEVARKIGSPKLEIDVKLNGKPYTGKLSLETLREMGIVE